MQESMEIDKSSDYESSLEEDTVDLTTEDHQELKIFGGINTANSNLNPESVFQKYHPDFANFNLYCSDLKEIYEQVKEKMHKDQEYGMENELKPLCGGKNLTAGFLILKNC